MRKSWVWGQLTWTAFPLTSCANLGTLLHLLMSQLTHMQNGENDSINLSELLQDYKSLRISSNTWRTYIHCVILITSIKKKKITKSPLFQEAFVPNLVDRSFCLIHQTLFYSDFHSLFLSQFFPLEIHTHTFPSINLKICGDIYWVSEISSFPV